MTTNGSGSLDTGFYKAYTIQGMDNKDENGRVICKDTGCCFCQSERSIVCPYAGSDTNNYPFPARINHCHVSVKQF